MEVVNFVIENVNFREKNFLEAIILTIVSMILNFLLPHLQYRYKFISKMTGDDKGKAADFLAFFLIHIGTFKNYAFFEALFTNKNVIVPFWYNYIVIPIGFVLIAIGIILVTFSFQRLGLRGMYFGDHFGFLFKKRIDQFPYNYLENPQYVGSNMIYFGLSLATKSLTGIMLTFFIILMYRFNFVFFERKKLREFYPKYESDSSTGSEDNRKGNKKY